MNIIFNDPPGIVHKASGERLDQGSSKTLCGKSFWFAGLKIDKPVTCKKCLRSIKKGRLSGEYDNE